MSEEKHNPLDQFRIHPIRDLEFSIFGYDIALTNSALAMFAATALAIFFLSVGMRGRALVPGRWQSMVELIYEFISGMVKDTIGNEGRRFFPAIFTIFIFVLFCNLVGMLPGSFTATSHISITFALAGTIFVAVTLIGIVRHGTHFFSLFLPQGTPLWLMPLMFGIEVIAYFARPVSLSIRLAINMMVGHMLLKVIAGFVIMMGLYWGWIPFPFLLFITGFEFFVALLQAYIFTILTCVYLHDAVHLH